ncbi:VOC family protein [Algoriphagus sp. Y33]|uniref:VOC family protein n=1 Tax=Algoriphagus sp. Y33 TaxID=2772483 RepID=UPI001784C6DE|nr:VOC family protein [Algoriphagus sp. Y33]
MTEIKQNLENQKNGAIELCHLIILAKDKIKTADFITTLLDLPRAIPADGPVPYFFRCIEFGNDVTILITEFKEHPIGYYAFKVTSDHFEKIVEKMKKEKMDFWADPRMQRPFEIYEQDGNKGFYVIDPS